MKNSKITKTANTNESNPPKNKRSKAYREWKKNHENASSGLGDTVEKITKKTGIKKAVDTVFQKLEKDCGCDQRKETLNKMFPYEKPECFTEEDFNVVHDAITTNKNQYTSEEMELWKDIYQRVFPNSKRPECTKCSFRSVIYDKLKRVYLEYK